MSRPGNENQIMRPVQNNANVQAQQNAQEQQNAQMLQNAQNIQNAQANNNNAEPQPLENVDIMGRPSRAMMDVINGVNQNNPIIRGMRERFDDEDQDEAEQINAQQINAQKNTKQQDALDRIKKVPNYAAKMAVLEEYEPVKKKGPQVDRIGSYIKKAPKEYKKKLDNSSLNPAVKVLNMSMAIQNIMREDVLGKTGRMEPIFKDIEEFQGLLNVLKGELSDEEFYDEDGYFDFEKSGKFEPDDMRRIATKLNTLRTRLDSYVLLNSGLFHAKSKKGSARLKAVKDLCKLIDYELIDSLQDVTKITMGMKPRKIDWVLLDQNDFRLEEDNANNQEQDNENTQSLIEKKRITKAQVDRVVEGVSFTPEQRALVTEDEKKIVAELMAKEQSVEEIDRLAENRLDSLRTANLKIASRLSVIKSKMDENNIISSTVMEQFNRMFQRLIGGSSDTQTMAVEEQLLDALATGNVETIKAFAHQVRDELSTLPTDIESYMSMDDESIERISLMGVMFDGLRGCKTLFPENDSDETLNKIVRAKVAIADGIYRIQNARVTDIGRNADRFTMDESLFVQTSEERIIKKGTILNAGIRQMLGTGLADLKGLHASLKSDEETWKKYGKYFEDKDYTSNKDARLKPVGEINKGELSFKLHESLEESKKAQLSSFNTKLEAFAAKQGQSDRFYALCNLCKEADWANMTLSFRDREQFFDHLVMELSKYIETTGNRENKLDALMLRQDLITYMDATGIVPIRYKIVVNLGNERDARRYAKKLDKYEKTVVEQLRIAKSSANKKFEEMVPGWEDGVKSIVNLAKMEKSIAFKNLYNNRDFATVPQKEYLVAKGYDYDNMSLRDKEKEHLQCRIEDITVLKEQCNAYLLGCTEENKRNIVTAYKKNVELLYDKLVEKQNTIIAEEQRKVRQQEIELKKQILNDKIEEVFIDKTQEQRALLKEDDKKLLIELMAEDRSEEEIKAYADELLETKRMVAMKSKTREKNMDSQIKRLGFVSGTSVADSYFQRFFALLLNNSSDKETMAVEEQLMEALENGNEEIVKDFVYQVRDELIKLPTDLESYLKMDEKALHRIARMNFMYDSLRRSTKLFPENESDKTLDKIAMAKSSIACGLVYIKKAKLHMVGREKSNELTYNCTLFKKNTIVNEIEEQNGHVTAIGQAVTSGILALGILREELKQDPAQWEKYGKYYEDKNYTSSKDVKLKPVGEVNTEELSSSLSNTIEQSKKAPLAKFNSKLELLAAKQNQSESLSKLCELCKKADKANMEYSHSEREEFFDGLLIKLCEFLESAEVSEDDRLDVLLLRQELVSYMASETSGNIIPAKYLLNIAVNKGNMAKKYAPKLNKFEKKALDQIALHNHVSSFATFGEMVPGWKESFESIFILAEIEKSQSFEILTKNIDYTKPQEEYLRSKGYMYNIDDVPLNQKRELECQIKDIDVLKVQCDTYLAECTDQKRRNIVEKYKENVEALKDKLAEQLVIVKRKANS